MTTTESGLQGLPLRFCPPPGWRTPSPRWIQLHQGFDPPSDWTPYTDAPLIPTGWPWWEENGTAWFTFFRHRAPVPTRAMGNWFSLAALGLFSIIVSPFALLGGWILVGGITGLVLLILGIRGVITTYRRNATAPLDPLDTVREWAAGKREAFFEAERRLLGSDASPEDYERMVSSIYSAWWDESPSSAGNS